MSHSKKLETRAIHGGQEFDPTTGAVMPPIYTTSTYRQKARVSTPVSNTRAHITQLVLRMNAVLLI